MGQAISLHAPQDDAMVIQIGVCLCRCFFALGGKMNEHEISDTRRHPQTKRFQLTGQQAQPFLIMRDGGFNKFLVSDCRNPCSHGAALTLKGPRMRLSTSATWAGQ